MIGTSSFECHDMWTIVDLLAYSTADDAVSVEENSQFSFCCRYYSLWPSLSLSSWKNSEILDKIDLTTILSLCLIVIRPGFSMMS